MSQLYDRIEKQAPAKPVSVAMVKPLPSEAFPTAPVQQPKEEIVKKIVQTEVKKPSSLPAIPPGEIEKEKIPSIANAKAAMEALPPLTHSSIDLAKPKMSQLWHDRDWVAFDGLIYK